MQKEGEKQRLIFGFRSLLLYFLLFCQGPSVSGTKEGERRRCGLSQWEQRGRRCVLCLGNSCSREEFPGGIHPKAPLHLKETPKVQNHNASNLRVDIAALLRVVNRLLFSETRETSWNQFLFKFLAFLLLNEFSVASISETRESAPSWNQFLFLALFSSSTERIFLPISETREPAPGRCKIAGFRAVSISRYSIDLLKFKFQPYFNERFARYVPYITHPCNSIFPNFGTWVWTGSDLCVCSVEQGHFQDFAMLCMLPLLSKPLFPFVAHIFNPKTCLSS